MDNSITKELLIYGSLGLTANLITSMILSQISKKQQQESEQAKTKKQNLKQIKKFQLKMPKEILQSANCLIDELKYLLSPTCSIEPVPHLQNYLKLQDFPHITSPLFNDSSPYTQIYGGQGCIPLDSFIYKNSFTLSHCQFGPNQKLSEVQMWLAAGPRKNIFFKPQQVKACIVTCGGLCPGLNAVIREIVLSLNNNYQVTTVYGIQYGYKGFYSYPWLQLDSNKVKTIHHLGGTILGSSRGGFDADKIIQSLIDKQINHVYIIGGDGTQKGVNALFQEIQQRKLSIAICGLPKTIDNDIPIIDKSFGFETAVEEANKAIKSAYVESRSAEFGVGLVRLMGRHAGFIAMEAASASRNVNICLVPEFAFELKGQQGLLKYVYERLKMKNHIVIVVAEGADSAMKDAELPNQGKDASGNLKSGDIGTFLRDQIILFCKQQGINITLKYIDPTYMIRTVPANYYDKEICSQLAESATHGLMAGFTGFSCGHVNNDLVYIPLNEICSKKYTNTIQPNDRHWQRLLASTGQPNFLNDENNLQLQNQNEDNQSQINQ